MVLRSIGPITVFASLLLLASLHASAQEVREENAAQRYVCLTLDSKTVRCGYLVSDDGREVTLNTPDMGMLIVPKVNVLRMTDSPVGTMGNGGGNDIEGSERMLSKDRALQATRYFFAPSAHTLKSGEGYASVSPCPEATSAMGCLTTSLADSAPRSWVLDSRERLAKLADGVNVSAGALYNLGWNGGTVFFHLPTSPWAMKMSI